MLARREKTVVDVDVVRAIDVVVVVGVGMLRQRQTVEIWAAASPLRHVSVAIEPRSANISNPSLLIGAGSEGTTVVPLQAVTVTTALLLVSNGRTIYRYVLTVGV